MHEILHISVQLFLFMVRKVPCMRVILSVCELSFVQRLLWEHDIVEQKRIVENNAGVTCCATLRLVRGNSVWSKIQHLNCSPVETGMKIFIEY